MYGYYDIFPSTQLTCVDGKISYLIHTQQDATHENDLCTLLNDDCLRSKHVVSKKKKKEFNINLWTVCLLTYTNSTEGNLHFRRSVLHSRNFTSFNFVHSDYLSLHLTRCPKLLHSSLLPFI